MIIAQHLDSFPFSFITNDFSFHNHFQRHINNSIIYSLLVILRHPKFIQSCMIHLHPTFSRPHSFAPMVQIISSRRHKIFIGTIFEFRTKCNLFSSSRTTEQSIFLPRCAFYTESELVDLTSKTLFEEKLF